MFVVLLKFSENKAKAPELIAGHNAWIQRGIEDGILVVGSLPTNAGRAILANDTSLPALQARVNEDPFVESDVVSAEILEITPARTDARMSFLMR